MLGRSSDRQTCSSRRQAWSCPPESAGRTPATAVSASVSAHITICMLHRRRSVRKAARPAPYHSIKARAAGTAQGVVC